MYAPIIVFAYNRPEHLKNTLNALALNQEAKDSDLFVFIDGPKNEKGKIKNKQVENIARKFSEGYFKTITIKNSKQNKGLAQAVISGVTGIINEYGKVIVTEDDAVAAPSYLKFMNATLEYYENDSNIWSVGGYTVPMRVPEDYKKDVILTQRSSSYAWGTWKNRWDLVDWKVSDYKKFHWNFKNRKKFNLWGDDRASMLDDQMLGLVNSWAIRFDYAMFKNGKYNILPRKSLIQNTGHDGSGTHNFGDLNKEDIFKVDIEHGEQNFKLECVETDERIRVEFCKLFKSSHVQSSKRFIANLLRQVSRQKKG